MEQDLNPKAETVGRGCKSDPSLGLLVTCLYPPCAWGSQLHSGQQRLGGFQVLQHPSFAAGMS